MAKKRKKKDEEVIANCENLDEPVTNCDQSKELITNCDNPEEVVANCDQLDDVVEISSAEDIDIAKLIVVVRGQQVLIDRDIAMLYKVETKHLNERVKRNVARFPERFRFQLTKQEMKELVAKYDRFKNLKHSSSAPYAFTEQGISMLSAVVTSQKAVDTSIRIMDAFVGMRRYLSANAYIFQRLDRVERQQLENKQWMEQTDDKINLLMKKIKKTILATASVGDEYIMIQDLNDSLEDAKRLAKMLSRGHYKVNMIPYNGVTHADFKPSTTARLDQFRDTLMNAGITAITRRPRGEDIAAACGQLIYQQLM